MFYDVSIIIINYNTKKLTIECIHSVYRHVKDIKFEIIVVDNASSDGSVSALQHEFTEIILVKNKKNIGFAPANNQAIKIAKGRTILLLNSDTVLLNNAIKKLVTFLDNNPRAGIAGPQVLNRDKTIQSSFNRFPSLADEFLRAFRMEAWYVRRRIQNDNRIKTGHAFQVDWVSGCCFLIRKTAIKHIGLLDENYFLFNEEVDWCMRAKKADWDIFYIPEAMIIHFGGQSAGKNPYSYLIHRYKTRFYFFKKHFNPFVLILFRAIVSFGLFIRLSLVLFSSYNSREKKQRAKAYWECFLYHTGFKTGEY